MIPNSFKKIFDFFTHHNGVVVALELAIFVGVIFAFAAENSGNNELGIIMNQGLGTGSETAEQINDGNNESGIMNQGTTEIKAENLEELKIKEVQPGKYAFKALDDSVIEIGVERHSPPKPYIKLNKWDGEVSLKIGIPFETGASPTIIGDKIRYSTADKSLTANSWWQKLLNLVKQRTTANAQESQPRIDIEFYPRQPEEITEITSGKTQTFTQNEDGGVEFDTILYEKPNTNQIIFPIETQGLKFYYQPPLTEEEIAEGAFRPENVVGSYAVYHESKQGDYSKMGGKNYMAGKAFHIYRPKIYDATGNWTWGELSIEAGLPSEALAKEGILTITIPQDWLDNAVYPVIIDPNFGYETQGSSTVTGINEIRGSKFSLGEDGIANSITIGTDSGNVFYYNRVVGAIYDASLNFKNDTEIIVDPYKDIAFHWITYAMTSSVNLSSGNYWLVQNHQSAGPEGGRAYTVRYDTGEANQGLLKSYTFDSWENPLTNPTYDTNKYSIYATYTAGGAAGYQPRPGGVSPSGGGFLMF